MPINIQKLAIASLALTLLGLIAVFYIGGLIVAPQNRDIGDSPPDIRVEKVSFPSESGATIFGWWKAVPTAKGTVLLLHGIRADRRSMLGRARFLSEMGYQVLLIDFQAHGESVGRNITLGKLESLDVAAALTYIQNRSPDIPISIIGSSLGGASAILCESEVKVNAIVVEAVFSSVTKATANRLEIKLGPAGRLLAPLLTWQVPLRLRCSFSDISPLEKIESVSSSIFIINGSEDRRATEDEARELFRRAQGQKKLWIVEGAAHIDLHRFAKAEYEKQVLAFLEATILDSKPRN